MTLLPAAEVDIRKIEGPEYKVDLVCSNPNCQRSAVHRHHIVRRSALGGAYDWVEIQGIVVGNVAALCLKCHNEITENKNGIFFVNDESGNRGFFWGGEEYGLLSPHPPTDGTWTASQVLHKDDKQPGDPCKRCHGTGTEPKHEDPEWTEEGGEKPKTVFAIRIPKAELSFGYDSLRQLINQAGDNLSELGYDSKTPPYYILSAVLHDWNEGRTDVTQGADSPTDL